MFQLLNRIAWVVCIGLGIAIASIDNDMIIAGIILAVTVKYIVLSPAQHKKMKDLVNKFVEQGGSIEFIK